MKMNLENRLKYTCVIYPLLTLMFLCIVRVHGDEASLTAQFKALGRYQSEVRSLVLEAQLSGNTTPPLVIEYLKICTDNANFLFEILGAPADQRYDLSRRLSNSLQLRRMKQDEILDEGLSGNSFVVSENKLREELSQSAVAFNNLYIESLLVQKSLLQLKYFEDDDPKSANYLEGFLNSNIPFLRYSSESKDKDNWHRHHGISNWEMTIRAEPVVLFNHEKDPAVLLAGGMLYNIFPSVGASTDNPLEAILDHTILSKCIKRMGPRMGVGARFGEGTDFIFGGGMQVATFTVWSLYDSSESEFTLAVGISDWEWVNKVLPMFGKN